MVDPFCDVDNAREWCVFSRDSRVALCVFIGVIERPCLMWVCETVYVKPGNTKAQLLAIRDGFSLSLFLEVFRVLELLKASPNGDMQ